MAEDRRSERGVSSGHHPHEGNEWVRRSRRRWSTGTSNHRDREFERRRYECRLVRTPGR